MPQEGQLLHERYQLKQELGKNASRQTWLATDVGTQPNETVIVKLLALTPQMQWDDCRMFEREAQVLQNLNHPRIPKYRDYFVLDNQPDLRFAQMGLVQDYIPGTSLKQLLDRGQRFTEAQVQKIAVEVLSILVYLHELSPPVLHRDIKPSNLIWTEDERVYLVDFGAVQDQAVVEGATFTVVGTYGYVPIEQFGGRAVPASDLYALGATLIHLLTGIAPADLPTRDSRIQFFDRVSVDLGFANWISKLTEPSVCERISTARQALLALETRHTLSPPVVTPKPTGSRIQLQKSATRLEIKIPRRGFKGLSILDFVGTFLLGVLCQLPIFFNSSRQLLAAGSIILPAIIIWLGPTFEETYLFFNREYFEIGWKLFGCRYWRRREPIAKIMQVCEEEAKGIKGITIKLHKGKYTSNPLSKVERIWLIQEIKDWLEIK